MADVLQERITGLGHRISVAGVCDDNAKRRDLGGLEPIIQMNQSGRWLGMPGFRTSLVQIT